jgi:Pro-kumamolisin, activation domain/Immunoglobulin I-set domain
MNQRIRRGASTRLFATFPFQITTVAAAFLMAVFLLAATAGRAQSARTLHGHVPDVLSRLRPLANIDARTNLQLAVGLPLRNKEALTNLLQDLYNPGNPHFHRYLTVSQFTEQFGLVPADYQKVMDYLTSHRLKVTAMHPNRMVVDVAGAAADVEKAFHVHLRTYQHPTENRKFFAPDTEPWVDANVPVLDVMGLDNYIVPHPADLHRIKAGGNSGTTVTNFAEQGSGPGGTYIGNDFRTAYVPGVTNTGAGQYIGLVEFGPYWTNDIHTYEVTAGLSTNIVISNVFLDGVTEPPAAGTDAGEQAIDMEMCISMAPGATVLYYGGNVVDDIYSRIASDNLAKQISCSFGFGIDSTTEQLYQEFVAQGQNFFVASGDGGAEVGTIDPPAAEPYITVVGGTALYTVSPGGAWQQELTWGGSGGGVSTFYAIPDYQQGIDMAPLQGSSTMRNFPDVAMMADFVMFVAANNTTSAGGIGGTSFASPEYAGFYALANQQAASLGQPPLGFFNPALYALGKSANYTKCFHDITVGNTTNDSSGPEKFFAATGYDLCTGWGSPNGSNLINALTGVGTNNFFLYANPVTLNLTIGGNGTVLVTDQPMNGFAGSVSLSVSGLPAGVTASFSSGSTTTTSILTLTANSGATPGTYTITLNGVSGSIAQSVALTVNLTAETPGFSRVNLSSAFNLAAIYTDGSAFSGGADGGGNAYSANLLGSALSWNGCLFTKGSANANDAVQCSGQTISLPSGKFSSLQILAAAVGGAQTSQPFVVTYTDGSTSVFIQSVSDWTAPQNFPGEAVVAATSYRNTGGGAKDTVTGANIYGYSFGLNNTKTVQSVKLPGVGNILVFAMTLANDFTLYGAPSSLVLTAGGASASYLVSGPINGFSGSVNLSALGLPPGVTASFNPSSSSSSSIVKLTANATAQPVNTNVMLTGTLDGVTHNITVNLSVITPIPGTATVSLASAFNLDGIYDDGATFSTNGGLDGAGNAYSANLLGSAPNWNGGLFSLGAAGTSDAVQCAGQTIALAAGQYTGLLLLGAAINASQPNQTFQINYTDGTSATVNQSISIWTQSQGYAGESIALSTAYVNTGDGTNNTAVSANVYGYVLPLNDSKTVKSITLPSNPDVVVLAMTLANAPTTVSLASAFNRAGIHTDGASYSGGGLDGGGYAYSATLLGSSQIWDSVQFEFGPPNVNDVIACSSQIISLPANRYTTLLILAAGVEGNQTSQTFTVTYADGTATPIVQSLSDWVNVTGYSNQFVAVTMPYRLFSNGSGSSATTHVYGYLLPLNNTKTVKSLRLPNNGNVEVLAVTLANTPLPAPLQAYYNRASIFTDGTKFTTPGLDDDGNALSATLLGPDETWHDSFFEYGQANVTNVISGAGQTIALPQGQYSALLMLASCVNGSQASQSFTVHYTNGTSASFTPSMSDWAVPQHFSGETIVVAMGYRDSGGGSKVGPPVNVYGYSMALNGNDVVQSLTLPNNDNVEVLAITLSNYTAALPEAPAIVTQPQSLTVTNGNPAAFAVMATGSPTLAYQWQINGTNLTDGGSIAGSSTAALSVNPADATNAGSYDVVVANAYGSVTSSVATLNVVFSFQSAVQNSDGSVSFTWLTTPGVPYQVQYTTNLALTNWINLGPAIVASNSVTTASDTNDVDPQRFYRIIQQ